MKRTQRIPALLLAMAMAVSLCLTGCQKKEAPVTADKAAVALFELVLKDDASSLVELFGYTDEAEARKDMGLGESGIYDELADQMVAQFKAMNINASGEDAQKLVDAFLTMFKGVKLDAVVKESDEKAGTAVVTCTINTFDANAMTDAINNVMTDILSDEELINSEDEDALYSAILNKMSEAIASLTPTENKKDFDVDFVLEEHTISGKNSKIWLPKDAEAFGTAISNNAMGG